MNKETVKKASVMAGAIVIVIGLLIYFFGSFQMNSIPADFTAARQKASSVSQDIVNLTGDTGQKIAAANQLQNGGNADASQIMNVIDEAKATNLAAYQKAFELSSALQQMASALNAVSQPRQQLGYEAVALELSLVSEFISYTGALNDFLNNLSRAIANQSSANRKIVEDSLAKVNEKADLINSINKSFLAKMGAFDQAK